MRLWLILALGVMVGTVDGTSSLWSTCHLMTATDRTRPDHVRRFSPAERCSSMRKARQVVLELNFASTVDHGDPNLSEVLNKIRELLLFMEQLSLLQNDNTVSSGDRQHLDAVVGRYVHDLLAVSVRLWQVDDKVAAPIVELTVSLSLEILSRDPASILNIVIDHKTWLDRVLDLYDAMDGHDLGKRLLRTVGRHELCQRCSVLPSFLLSHLDPDLLGRRQSSTETVFSRAFRLLPCDSPVLEAICSIVSRQEWCHTWISSLNHQSLSKWTYIFSHYNNALLGLGGYDMERFLDRLWPSSASSPSGVENEALPDSNLVRDVRRSVWIRHLWQYPDSQTSLVAFIFVLFGDDPDLLAHYEVTSDRDLLKRIAPDRYQDTDWVEFTYCGRDLFRPPTDDSDRPVDVAEFWSAFKLNMDVMKPTPMQVALQELSKTAEIRRSPRLINLVGEIVRFQLQSESIAVMDSSTLVDHQSVIRDQLAVWMPNMEQYQNLPVCGQIRCIITEAAAQAETVRGCNLAVLALAWTEGVVAPTQAARALGLVARFVSHRALLSAAVLDPRLCSTLQSIRPSVDDRYSRIYQRLLLILLNTASFMERTAVRPGKQPSLAVSILQHLISKLNYVLLVDICLLSPDIYRILSQYSNRIAHVRDLITKRQVLLAIERIPNNILDWATPEIVSDRDETCSICLEPNVPPMLRLESSPPIKIVRRQPSVVLPCKHCFHHRCILPVLLQSPATCPLCRGLVSYETLRLPMPDLTISEADLAPILSQSTNSNPL